MVKNSAAPVQALDEKPTAPATRSPRGEGHTITIDLKEHPKLLAHIRQEASNDDREPSKWLRRHIVKSIGVTE